jgi:sigma-E factor negative regulatory protein RseA
MVSSEDAMDDRMDRKELISALADGQLRGAAFAEAVEAACEDGEAMASWHAYHVIGEVLRSQEAFVARPAQDFLAKVTAGIAQDKPVPVAAPQVVPVRAPAAANDDTFRWKLVAGVASFAAVGAIGWSLVTGTAPGAGPQLATAPQQAPASAPSTVLARTESGAVMIRDPKLDELLAAHRQLGGVSALQMPAGFVRNATFESSGR